MTYPGAPRNITIGDVENLKECELIHRYGFYSTSQDGKTILGILKYEKMRERKSDQKSTGYKSRPPKCKMCGQSIPEEPEGKGGRPKEYCHQCSPLRGKERQKKLRQQHRNQSYKVGA
ncbi:hypothetical protein ACFLV5_04250 [Chloroflexota bacterium]